MKITFDPKADALYIYLKDEASKVARTKSIDDETMIDVDAKGKVVGVEILNASARVPLEKLKHAIPIKVLR